MPQQIPSGGEKLIQCLEREGVQFVFGLSGGAEMPMFDALVDSKIKLVLVYPMTVGRNFDEVLRVIDSLQLGAKHKVATPAQWKQGDDVIIAGSVTDDDAKKLFPQGWKSPKPYIRIVPQPK